jgi:hypothetical protein
MTTFEPSLLVIVAPVGGVLTWSTFSIVRGVTKDRRERFAVELYETAYALGIEYGRAMKRDQVPCPAVPLGTFTFIATAPRRARRAMHEQNMRLGHGRGLHVGWVGEAFDAGMDADRKARTALQTEIDRGLAEIERFANERENE